MKDRSRGTRRPTRGKPLPKATQRRRLTKALREHEVMSKLADETGAPLHTIAECDQTFTSRAKALGVELDLSETVSLIFRRAAIAHARRAWANHPDAMADLHRQVNESQPKIEPWRAP